MAQDPLRTLRTAMEAIRPALTAPGWRRAWIVMLGWLLTHGLHAVTGALVATGVAGLQHHEAFHRFFSRGTWSPDAIGRLLVQRAVSLLVPQGAAVRFAIDDTLASKKGAKVFGLGSHLDAVRSTKAVRVFAFGHVWVVAALLVPVPFSSRTWALPVVFRLYRNLKECTRHGATYRKKTELARQCIDLLVSWLPMRRIEVAMDSAYCNDTVMRRLPDSVVVFGAMRPDAVLTALPEPVVGRRQAGRPALRGKPLPKPEQLARNADVPWREAKVHMYGRTQAVHYKTIDAQWYVACGTRLLRIVVVRCDSGKMGLRVFFCTDHKLTPEQILAGYSERWSIECAFKNLKQHLGFADSSARKQAAVERTAPFVGYLYTLLILWFADGVHAVPVAAPPCRPWYRHKRDASFADILRTAQTVVRRGIADPTCDIDNLGKTTGTTAEPAVAPHPPPPQLGRLAA